MKKKQYLLVKDKYNNETMVVNYETIDGFKFKPMNKVKNNGLKVNSIIIVKPSMIEKLLRIKITKKLKAYLKYVLELLETDNDDDTSYHEALNELERYKNRINNLYRDYLDDEYVKLLIKKINLIEHELKIKIMGLSFESKEIASRSR